MDFRIEQPELQSIARARNAPESLVRIWNLALGEEFALSVPHLRHRLQHPPSWPFALAQAVTDAGPAGFVLVSTPPTASETTSPAAIACIDALAVHPDHQRQGIARALVDWALTWSQEHNCTRLQLGSGPIRLMPGVPARAADHPAWSQLHFTPGRARQDLVCAVSTYMPPDVVVEIPGLVRPLAAGEEDYLRAFLDALAPTPTGAGVAPQTFTHFLEQGGRRADIMGLWTEAGLSGAARIIVEDSVGGIEPWFPYPLPKPWAALQLALPVDTAPQFQAALVDAALRRLHNMGVNSCILGEITAPEAFAPFGFEPYATFHTLQRSV